MESSRVSNRVWNKFKFWNTPKRRTGGVTRVYGARAMIGEMVQKGLEHISRDYGPRAIIVKRVHKGLKTEFSKPYYIKKAQRAVKRALLTRKLR